MTVDEMRPAKESPEAADVKGWREATILNKSGKSLPVGVQNRAKEC
jgi:hypothetical protein